MPLVVLGSTPGTASWNMGLDDALLDWAAEARQPVLRWYGWQTPSLSLGYFQPLAQRETHPPSHKCPCVRRATGGGAILHHHDLTYSFAWPSTAQLGQSAPWYDLFHQALIDALGELGVTATLWGDQPQTQTQTQAQATGEPFLCFQRRAQHDVCLGQHKICGSAQRRRRGAQLQHGSLLLARSAAAPELPGLADLCGVALDADTMKARWQAQLLPRLLQTLAPHPGADQFPAAGDSEPYRLLVESQLPPSLLAAARQAAARHESGHWLGRR